MGGFRVKHLVGVGATGEIYQAIDERLGRKVALKLLKPNVVDERTVQRFVDEARTTAQFSHPHIVAVYAAGSHRGMPWLALEYLDGHSLRSRLESGVISPREAMRFVKAIAEGVAEAHRHHIIHADLKPENVIVPKDGRLRVLDFGLARLMGTSPTAASGTPAYMAPERWSGQPPTPAMDVWSIGVMLYEFIEGVRPLSDRQLAGYVFSPTPLPLGPKVSEQPCASLIARCLAVDPTQRPGAEEVAAQLSGMLDGAPALAPGEERAPFRGLDAFSEADAIDFHGRGAETDAFVELLRRHPLVPLTGPSGIGKSSFLQAGVVPRLREQERWVVIRCRPGRRPLWSLANALAGSAFLATPRSLAAMTEPPLSVDGVFAALSERPGCLDAYITRVSTEQASRVLLLVDQFEELFTLGESDEAKLAVEALGCLGTVGHSARVVLSLRDDFLGAFAAVPSLRESLGGLMVLPPLGKAALAEAVSAPLRRVRYAADSTELVPRIAAELEGQPSALPLLQFAMRSLWERRDLERRLVLTREYEAMGGATGALAAHAQRFLADSLPEERALTRSLMLRLVNADSTRRPRGRAELLDGLEPHAATVLDRLLSQRLLVSGRAAETEEALIELAHESLVTAWPALTRWLTETEEGRKLSQEIEQATALWVSRGQRDEETWSGPAVRQAIDRVAAWKLQLTARQAKFLEAGRRRDEARRRRRRRLMMAAFIGVTGLALASTAAAYAFRQKQLETLAQQKQITLAAADMGEFELHLEPFDWSATTLTATPAKVPPALGWRLHAPDVKAPNEPGRVYGEGDLIRHDAVKTDDAVVERVESRSGPAYLEVFGRGAPGQDCGSSWVMLKHLPGYSERSEHRVIRVPVPTCAATLAGLIRIPAGPFWQSGENDEPVQTVDLPEFWMARTETVQAEYEVYQRLSNETGDSLLPAPASVSPEPGPTVPVAALTFAAAERLCSFFGRKLPSLAQWQKAYRGGLRLANGDPNPNPLRAELCREPKCSNIDGAYSWHIAPAGTFPLDTSPEGIIDLQGNVSEWTRSQPKLAVFRGTRVVAGGNWFLSAREGMHRPTKWNTRIPEYVDFALGVRCVYEPPAP